MLFVLLVFSAQHGVRLDQVHSYAHHIYTARAEFPVLDYPAAYAAKAKRKGRAVIDGKIIGG